MNNGALLIDKFELYIHDCLNDITGPIGNYVANYQAGGFVCEDLNELGRVSRIFFSYAPYGSFRSKFISKLELLRQR